MSSFEELLRQAEMAQKQRDQATQALKDKKMKEDAEKRRRLMDQFKRTKPVVPVQKAERIIAVPSRPSTSAFDPRRPNTTPSTVNRPLSKPGKSKTSKPRSNPANPKQSTSAKTPTTVKPRPTPSSLSFAEMMKLAQNNVTQGVSPLDRPKQTPTSSLPKTTSSNDQHRSSAQKRKPSQMSSKASTVSRSTATTNRSSKQVLSAPVQNRLSRMEPSKPHRPIQDTRPQPSRIPAPKRPRYDDDEDGYDSLDDFIDDDEVDFEAERELKTVVQKLCRSDEATWKKREREIDLRRMENTFHGVQMEEIRSARIARMEDKSEEERGAKLL